MSSTTAATGASEAVARFVAGVHTGAAFDDALRTAREHLSEAQGTLQIPFETAKRASRALATYGTPLRRAFAAATTLAAAPGERANAPVVAAAVVSTLLAGRREADAVEAIAVGREVAARLKRALTLDAPWDTTVVIAGIAAAAAAARAAALDADATRHALGLAATQAAGLGVAEGTPAAAIAYGKVAADAVEAVQLARNGFTAAPASLEGRRGLAALMAARFDVAALCDDFGRRWFSAGR